MRVLMLDPSTFSLPYDTALAAALGKHSHAVTVVGRPLRPGEWGDGQIFDYEAEFYRRSEKVLGNPRMRTLAKMGEHLVDVARMIRRVQAERPDVVHVQWLVLPL